MSENLHGEIWKKVEYNEDYFVSNLGRVKSLKFGKERILSPSPRKDNNGYIQIKLSKNGKVKTKRIHTLMFESFNNYILEKNECVHHIDFTKDNFLDNFQAMTKKEHTILHRKGMNHSEKTRKLMRENHADFKGEKHPMFGKHPSEKTRKLMSENNKGENGPNSKLTEQKVIQIRILLDEGILTQKEIAKKFGVSHVTISDIKNNRSWIES